jgi:cell division protein FtsB
MRDIGSRIQQYRLSRYGSPHRARRRLLWLGVFAWALWASVISDHSVYRLWRLGREQQRAQQDLERMREEIRKLDAERDDPEAQRDLAERALREKNGMARQGEIIYRIKGGSADTSSRD